MWAASSAAARASEREDYKDPAGGQMQQPQATGQVGSMRTRTSTEARAMKRVSHASRGANIIWCAGMKAM